jgi:hypothetical protein
MLDRYIGVTNAAIRGVPGLAIGRTCRASAADAGMRQAATTPSPIGPRGKDG